MSENASGSAAPDVGSHEFSIAEATGTRGAMDERELSLLDAMMVLYSLGVESDTLQPAAVAFSEFSRECDVLRRGVFDDSPDLRARLTFAANHAEQAFLLVDAKIPMEQFRRHFDETKIARNATARYARLLANRPFGTAERRDRYEFLVTRLVRQKQGDGSYRMLPADQAEIALRYTALRPLAGPDADLRTKAVDYFTGAAKKIGEFNSVDAIFSSGWYVNLYGFKATLGDSMPDPDVMRAVASLNVELANRIHALTGRTAGHPIMTDRMTAEEREAKEVLKAALAAPEEKVVARSFQSARRKAVAAAGVMLSDVTGGDSRVRWLKRGIAIALLVGSGAWSLVVNLGLGQPSQTTLNRAEIAQLSGVLWRGSLVPDDEGMSLLADVQSGPWHALTVKERQAALEKLRAAMILRRIRAAVLQDAGRPVAVINAEGELNLLE